MFSKANEYLTKKQTEVSHQEFTFGIKYLDEHIYNVLNTCDANYSQVSLGALATIGFILSHGGIKNTSLYFLDLSVSGSGKTHNISLQSNLLLKNIIKMQEDLQSSSADNEEVERFHNIHKGKITVPALNQCIKTVKAQLVVIDELGLLMQRGDDIIDEITKLYGVSTTALSVTKSELPHSKNIVPVAFSFIGATTLSYFGGSKNINKHLQGGFINRPFIAYNTDLKQPEDIKSIYHDRLDYNKSNQQALELYNFAKRCKNKFIYSHDSEMALLELRREIQGLKIKYHEMGSEFGAFYSRVDQNTYMLLNILHTLRCYEKKRWEYIIELDTTQLAIKFVKEIIFKEIDKLIFYLADSELLVREERQKYKIVEFVNKYEKEFGKMPKIRDISIKYRLSKAQVLELTKDYLEVVPSSTVLRYCNGKTL
jgi:hypothetical protein